MPNELHVKRRSRSPVADYALLVAIFVTVAASAVLLTGVLGW